VSAAQILLEHGPITTYIIPVDAKDSFKDNTSLLAEFWRFVRYRKRYWLLPFFAIIFLLAVFIILTESSAFAPFIYSLF
jgi:hypothetical protein